MDHGAAFMPGVPGFPPGAFWVARVTHTKSPRRKPGDSGSHLFPLAMRCGFEPVHHLKSSSMDHGAAFVPGVPGFPPEAFGVARVTHSKSPRRKPRDSGSHLFPLAMRCGFEPVHHLKSSSMDHGAAFVPGVPGFPPGAFWVARVTHSKSPRRKPGDSGSHAIPRAMSSRFPCAAPHGACESRPPPSTLPACESS